MYQLAQLNVAHARAPGDSPLMAEFHDNIARVNAIAEDMPGFVWRWETPEGDTSEERVFGPGRLVNVSVWDSLQALSDFAYEGVHLEFLRRRREWFQRTGNASLVLWWVPAGHRPSLEQAAERLQWLQTRGPGPQAFTFRESFSPPQVQERFPATAGAAPVDPRPSPRAIRPRRARPG